MSPWLFIAFGVLWIAVIVFAVSLCMAAAEGDRIMDAIRRRER